MSAMIPPLCGGIIAYLHLWERGEVGEDFFLALPLSVWYDEIR